MYCSKTGKSNIEPKCILSLPFDIWYMILLCYLQILTYFASFTGYEVVIFWFLFLLILICAKIQIWQKKLPTWRKIYLKKSWIQWSALSFFPQVCNELVAYCFFLFCSIHPLCFKLYLSRKCLKFIALRDSKECNPPKAESSRKKLRLNSM